MNSSASDSNNSNIRSSFSQSNSSFAGLLFLAAATRACSALRTLGSSFLANLSITAERLSTNLSTDIFSAVPSSLYLSPRLPASFFLKRFLAALRALCNKRLASANRFLLIFLLIANLLARRFIILPRFSLCCKVKTASSSSSCSIILRSISYIFLAEDCNGLGKPDLNASKSPSFAAARILLALIPDTPSASGSRCPAD